jgi:hypothetical protein
MRASSCCPTWATARGDAALNLVVAVVAAGCGAIASQCVIAFGAGHKQPREQGRRGLSRDMKAGPAGPSATRPEIRHERDPWRRAGRLRRELSPSPRRGGSPPQIGTSGNGSGAVTRATRWSRLVRRGGLEAVEASAGGERRALGYFGEVFVEEHPRDEFLP